jgi:hypothetical protein
MPFVAFDLSEPNAILRDKPACDHAETSEVVTKEATCTEDGSKNIVCDACGDVIKTEVIPAKGHDFKAENGSYICRELLSLGSGASDPEPEKRTQSYYRKRPCAELVKCAAEITEKYIAQNK